VLKLLYFAPFSLSRFGLAGSPATLLDDNGSQYSIAGFQLLPIITIATRLASFTNGKACDVYDALFLTAMVVTWIVVASTALQFAF